MKTKYTEINKFKKYLEKQDLALTPARSIVLNEALKQHGHFATEELYKVIKSKSKKASRASVYRSIKELLEAGIIRETAFGEKHKHYEHLYDEKHHHHARCVRCNNIIEFSCNGFEKDYIKTLSKNDFKIIGHELHFYGICKNCYEEKIK